MEGTAIILAGGKSRRMGVDKAGLLLEGESFVARLTARFRTQFGQVWVSGPGGLADLRPDSGPLGGLEAAFVRTGAERLFLTAVDLPFGEPELARLLLDALGEWDACLIRRRGGRVEPLFAAYRASCLPRIQACLDGGRRAMGALLEGLDCRLLAEEELSPRFDLERILLNVNTPEDYRRAEKISNNSLQGRFSVITYESNHDLHGLEE